MMSWISLEQARLTTSFWKYSLLYAIYLKNRLPHIFLNNMTPFEVFHGHRPNLDSVRQFGSLCYQIRTPDQRPNKFVPMTIAKIFLGYDDLGSFDSAVLYNPHTKRTSVAHLQDLRFNELKTYQQYRSETRNYTELEDPETKLDKHRKFLTESSDTDTDSEQPVTPPVTSSSMQLQRTEGDEPSQAPSASDSPANPVPTQNETTTTTQRPRPAT